MLWKPRDSNYTKQDEKLIMKEASSRFGIDVEILITYCNGIERTKSGKLKFVISDIS